MDENVLALLERSGIYYSVHRPFPIKIELGGFHGFRFFIPFYSSDKDHNLLAGVLKGFLQRYIQTWARIAEHGGNFSWEQYSQKVFDCFGRYDWSEIYEKFKDGKREQELAVRVNGSKVKIKRLGNIIAFDVENSSLHRKEHSKGVKAILRLCRAEDPYNNQGVYELLREVRASFPLEPNTPEKSNNIFDLRATLSEIFAVFGLPFRKSTPEELVQAYTEKPKNKIILAFMHGFEMSARLMHGKELEVKAGSANFEKEMTERSAKHEKESHNDSIWRKGNVERVNQSSYRFENFDYLRLEISLKTSLPDGIFENNVDPEAKIHDEQIYFTWASALFISRLCSMQMGKRIQKMKELNP